MDERQFEDESNRDRAPRARRRGGGDGSVAMRFRIAQLLRVPNGIIGKAISAYSGLFDVDDERRAEIYRDIGSDLARHGKIAEAQAALRRTLDLCPDDAAAWVALGLTHMDQEAPGAAAECFERACALEPEGFEQHFHLAQALSDLDQPQEAAVELRLALEARPEAAEASYQLGILLDGLGRLDEAVVAFQSAIEHAPKIATYHQILGFTLESLGRRDEAIACFKRALHLERRTSPAR